MMISAKNLLLAFGVAGAAVAATLNVMARDARRRDRHLQRVALQPPMSALCPTGQSVCRL
jgi:hypothetical protein